MSSGWNNAAEQSIATALGMVPQVGSILSALVFIMWPDNKANIWAEIEKDVERLLDKKLSERVKQQVSDTLEGLRDSAQLYLNVLKRGDASATEKQWFATRTIFVASRKHFQSDGYNELLLPLFTQYANMRLSLERDGVMKGASWGWTEEMQKGEAEDLAKTIGEFDAYALGVYATGLESVKKNTKANKHNCQPFRAVNAYTREMTLTVLDFHEMWKYFDATKYPDPVKIVHTREIFSDPVGTCDDSGDIILSSTPTQPISQYRIWAGDRIMAAQVTYPTDGGPGGVTMTARMGYPDGGSDGPPRGGVVDVSDKTAVTVAGGWAGDIVNGFKFTSGDGATQTFGHGYVQGTPFAFSYPDEILSRIHINGISRYFRCADCAVFGFKFAPDRRPSEDARRILFVSRLDEPAVDAASDPQWAEERSRFWTDVTARVAALDAP